MTQRNPVGGKQMYEPLNVGAATAQNQFSGSFNYIYDADGNMTQNGGAHYTYDAEDRLMSAGGVTYTYDGEGKRVMKSSGTIYWGEGGALAETDLSGNIHLYLARSPLCGRDREITACLMTIMQIAIRAPGKPGRAAERQMRIPTLLRAVLPISDRMFASRKGVQGKEDTL